MPQPIDGTTHATTTSESGGTMIRVAAGVGEGRLDPADLEVLEAERDQEPCHPLHPTGEGPYLATGQRVTWHYQRAIDVLRVVRDDERGLVAWLPSGSERVVPVPVDGRGLRDRPPAERFTTPVELRVVPWRGPGVLRIAPTGVPWSIWYFTEDDGTFAGHYVNLELPHLRPALSAGAAAVPDALAQLHTRDLVLDLWAAGGEVWLKDEDELEGAVEVGRATREQAEAVRRLADVARRDLLEARAWPLDEPWEEWRPPAGWDEPLTLPDHAADGAVRA